MEKPTLFFDFDGFKFNTLPAHMRYINQRYHITSTESDFIELLHVSRVVKKYLPDNQSPSKEEIYLDLAENFLKSWDWHKDIPPIEGMCQVVPLLAKKYTLWTVTARQISSLPTIERLLNMHIPSCISGVHCVWEHLGGTSYRGEPKKDFILKFPGKKIAFIDDNPEEIKEMGTVIPTYLFDPKKYHNHLTDIPNRVYSWQHIGEIFL